MRLFLIIFLSILSIYFLLYFFRIRKKKTEKEVMPTDNSSDASSEQQTPAAIETKPAHAKNASIGKDEWIVLKVVAAKEKPYQGYEMIQTLLAEGLRFGRMNIFHRHQQNNGKGTVLFSLASIAKPGTFDLNNIGALKCLGFTLFFSITRVENPKDVLNLMIETAQNIAEELGGELYTHTHQLLTDEQLQRLHCNVQLLQEKLHTPDLFTKTS
jgi:cell division protein ZipA